MISYPYFHLPYYNRYSRYGYRYPNMNTYYNSSRISLTPKKESKQDTHKNEFQYKEKKEEESLKDSPLFQIFGINLYFDDILIICLIFFLYQEGVKDESLFIALILLLLS